MMHKKERNASIDIFRIVGAIMVVAIHTGPLSEKGYAWWYLTAQVLPRLGVPFFFCTFGYYYIGSLMRGQHKFLETMKRLLVTYGIWSIIYYLPDGMQVLSGSVSVVGFLMNCARHFIFYGSREHFWFFPAVFLAMAITTLFERKGKLSLAAGFSVAAYVLGLLGCSYYEIGNRIPFLSGFVNASYYDYLRRMLFMGFPFFMMGYFLQKVSIETLKNKKLIIGSLVCGIGFFVEIYWVNRAGIQRNIYVTIFLYLLLFYTMLLLLKNPMRQWEKAACVSRDISNFMYYSHPFFISWIRCLFQSVWAKALTGTELFLLTVVSTVLAGYILHRMDHKYLNRLYKG